MAIEVDSFDLSLRSAETGRHLTANVYFVDGVTDATGAPRALSIGQLVMALCLARASELEMGIISLMNEMNGATAKLEALSTLEKAVTDWASRQTQSAYYRLSNHTLTEAPYTGVNYYDFITDNEYGIGIDLGVTEKGDVRINDTAPHDDKEILFNDFATLIEAKMDEMNSFSQQKMIELQSQTAKRDQSYDMISNVLKSLNTVLVGTVNNM